jgi:hypothetical protein
VVTLGWRRPNVAPRAGDATTSEGPPPHEGERERINRELIEFLNELRVALPGVQVLFAFLLTVPFSQRFHAATRLQRGLYFASLLAALVASVLLIAPSADHRLHFRRGNKQAVLLRANRYAIAGLLFLGLSLAGVVALVTDVLYGTVVAGALGLVALCLIGGFWYIEPLRSRGRRYP